MIEKDKILKLIKGLVEEKELFIVELEVSKTNSIHLLVDNLGGIKIHECVELSRAIEKGLDREEEDFDLVVSSPGLDSPMKVKQQFEKNLGREVKVSLQDGKKLQGKLLKAEREGFTIEERKKVRVEGKKKKQTIIEQQEISFNEAKEVKLVIKF